MKTSNVALLAEIDILELRIDIDANKLEVVKEFDRMADEIAELREALVVISLNPSFQANMPHEADLIENLLSKQGK